MQVRESWQNVGHRIHFLRKQNHLTLRQLAKGCGLSINAISLVERGQVAPTVETLCKIAGALGVRASSFLQEVCPNEINIHRALEMDIKPPSADFIHLCSIGCFADHCFSETGYWQQSVLCMSGEAEFEDSDGQAYLLKPGDRLTCNGNAPQRWRNPGEDPVIVVLAILPRMGSVPANEIMD